MHGVPVKIRVTITGRSYHFAQHIPSEIEINNGATLGDAIDALNAMLSEETMLPPTCIVAVNNDQVGTIASHSNPVLVEGAELLFVTPVAGG